MKQPTYETRRIVDGDVVIDKDVPISMRDGVMLWCNVFRPAATDGGIQVPPIVSFTCYGKDSDVAVEFKRYWDVVLQEHPELILESSGKFLTWEVPDPEYWVSRGYAVVVVDARGTGKSPGFFDMFSEQESADYYEAIEWAGVQPWSTGKVGTLGVSYLAIKQWQTAALQPPHLAAMIPWEGAVDLYRETKYHGGIFSNFINKLVWDTQLEVNQHGNAESNYKDRFTGERSTGPAIAKPLRVGSIADIYRATLDHPLDDAYNQQRTADVSRIDVPLLSAGNWGGLGLHLRGNVDGYLQASSRHKWLEMHGDSHFASMYLSEGVALQTRFFDRFLKGELNGFDSQPPLILTIRDPRGNLRRAEHEWPLARTRWTPYYLSPEGLGPQQPTSDGQISYAGLTGEVTLRTAPFERDTEFLGPVAATLYVSSQAKDMDLFLTVRLFDPQGKELTFRGANDPKAPITQGWLRVSHRKLDDSGSLPYRPRHPHDAVDPLAPGEVAEVQVEIWPTSIVVPSGYSLALTIGAKDFDRPEDAGQFMRGSGLFIHNDPQDRSEATFAGANTIHTGPSHRSFLLLPEISR